MVQNKRKKKTKTLLKKRRKAYKKNEGFHFERGQRQRYRVLQARNKLGKRLNYDIKNYNLPLKGRNTPALLIHKHANQIFQESAEQLLYSAREAILTRQFSRVAAIIGELLSISVVENNAYRLLPGQSTQEYFITGYCLQLGWIIKMLHHDMTQQEKYQYCRHCGITSHGFIKRYAYVVSHRLLQEKGVNNDYVQLMEWVQMVDKNPMFYRVNVEHLNMPRLDNFLPRISYYVYQPLLYWCQGLAYFYFWCCMSQVFGDESEIGVSKLEQNPDVINNTDGNMELKKLYLDAHLDLAKAMKVLPVFPAQTLMLMVLFITMGEYSKAVDAAVFGYKGNLQSVDALSLYILSLRAVGENKKLTPVEWAKLYLKAIKLDPLQLAALRDLHLQFVDGGVPICMLVEGFLSHLDVCKACQKLGLHSDSYEEGSEDDLVCPSNAWQYLSECLNQAAEQALLYLPEEMNDWVEMYKDKVRMEVDTDVDEETSMWRHWLFISQMIQDRAYWWQHTHFDPTTLPKKPKIYDQGKDLSFRGICAAYILGSDNQYVKKINAILKKYEQLQSQQQDLKRNRLISHHLVNTYNEVKFREKMRQEMEEDYDILVQKKQRAHKRKEFYGVMQSGEEKLGTEENQDKIRVGNLPKEWWNLFPQTRQHVT